MRLVRQRCRRIEGVGVKLSLADCWRVSGEVGAGVERRLVAAGCFGGGGLAVRRSRRGASRAKPE